MRIFCLGIPSLRRFAIAARGWAYFLRSIGFLGVFCSMEAFVRWPSTGFYARDGRSPDVVERWRRGDLVSSWGEAIYVGMVELVAWPGGSNHRLNTSTLCSGRAAVSFASLGGWGGAHVGETWGESELCRRASTLPTWL